MEPKYRSHFLYEQIKSFEDKVYKSFEEFNVDILNNMFNALLKRTVVDRRKVKTLAHLRKCHTDLKKVLHCKKLHRHLEQTFEEHKLVSYFNWFFQYVDYLRHLRDNFVDRIYNPLFRYFYNIGYDMHDREDTTDSGELLTHRSSALSFRSLDSGYSGLTNFALENDRLSASLSGRSLLDQTEENRRKIVTRNALIALGKEFKDIKKLYDTAEIEKLAERLTHLRSRTDHLLDVENALDPLLLSQDSEKSVFHLKIKDDGPYNLMRLISDILMKFQKEAWLARKWLELDDQTTKDLNEKLDKLTRLEQQMNRRLRLLTKEIQTNEDQLEAQTASLSTLLKREDRANDLGESVFVLNQHKDVLEGKLQKLNAERTELCDKITAAVNQKDKNMYRKLKPLYEKNKLQRFALMRQIDTQRYRITLVESDMNMELELKTDVIHTTNDVQDKCEELEQRIDKARKEQRALQKALLPIIKDKNFVKEQIQMKDLNQESEGETDDEVFDNRDVSNVFDKRDDSKVFDKHDVSKIFDKRDVGNEVGVADMRQTETNAHRRRSHVVKTVENSVPNQKAIFVDPSTRTSKIPVSVLVTNIGPTAQSDGKPNQTVSNQQVRKLSTLPRLNSSAYAPEVVASEW